MDGIFPSTISVESILAWRDVCMAEYQIEMDYFCIRIYDRIRKITYHYMPLGTYREESFQTLIDRLYEENKTDVRKLIFMDVREEELPWYRKLSGYHVRISANEAYSDYIYRREELEQAFERPGERYNKRYFIRNYHPVIRQAEISDGLICRDIVTRAFCGWHSCFTCTSGCLKDTISKFLEASEPETMRGIIVNSDGTDIGYAAGIIQRNTFVFLFKKNCRGYRGLDEYLQTELLKELPEHVRIINYTEDMGIEGLRNYKRRLAPYDLKPRYQVTVERMG